MKRLILKRQTERGRARNTKSQALFNLFIYFLNVGCQVVSKEMSFQLLLEA